MKYRYKHVFFPLLCLITIEAWASTCFNPTTECIESGSTKYFDGVPVALDCWRYRTTYECRDESDNNCETLRDQRCSQVKSECRKRPDGICAVQDVILSCPVERCDELGDVACGTKPFCVGDNCVVTTPIKATDESLGRTLSYLSAINDAASQTKEQNSIDPVIFVGKKMECSRYMLQGITQNCCDDKEHIFKCDAEDKELFEMKKAGRAIRIGEYCHTEKAGVCTSHHTAYCVFGSRIARIIQKDGRDKQLGIGFGYVSDDTKSSNVDCRGITKDELAKMKFNQMDFSELYDEMSKVAKTRMPKEEILTQKANSYTYDELKAKGTKNLGISGSSETSVDLKVAGQIKEFYERVKK